MLGYFFNPNAGFSLLDNFIGLFFNQVLGYFFNPNAGLSLSPVKLFNNADAAAESTGFLSPQEGAVLSTTEPI